MPAEVRLYNNLFTRPDPGADGDFTKDLNPNSLEILPDVLVEPSLTQAREGEAIQFERLGYFCLDAAGDKNHPVFNRTVGLRDSK
jgi:glutaminyl-tRNA synthetase